MGNIENDRQLSVTREKLSKLGDMMENLERTEKDPIRFGIEAEGIQSLIDQLESEIADYLETKEPLEAALVGSH